jgi:sigma-B regulation protein RsbU (phosphoserine phosphatase)
MLSEIAPCICFSTNDAGLVLDANEAACHQLGYEHATLTSINTDRFFTLATRIFHQTHLFPLLKIQGHAEEIFLTMRTQSGDDLPVLLNVARTVENGQGVCLFAGIVVRHRKQFEEDLIEARKTAEKALAENTELLKARQLLQIHSEELDQQLGLVNRQNQELHQFSRVVTHDVQEPLRKLQVFVQMLLDDRKPDDVPKLLEKIGRVSTQLRDIVSGLQQFVWLSDAAPRIVEIDLQRVLRMQAQRAEQDFPGVQLSLNAPAAFSFPGDREQVEWLFYELLTNALRFRLNPTLAEVSVTAELVQQNHFRNVPGKYQYKDYLRLRLQDSGIGFDMQYAGQTFELFRKLHPQSGRGIGLALCRKIVEHHQGTIDISSIKDEGTTVTILLPLHPEMTAGGHEKPQPFTEQTKA